VEENIKIGDVVRYKIGKGPYKDNGSQIGIIIKRTYSIDRWFYKIRWFGLNNKKRHWASIAHNLEKIC